MRNKVENGSDRRYYMFALRIMGEIVYLIAVPVVLLALLGKWLDGKLGTRPWFIIGGFLLAAVVSGLSVWRRARQLGSEYQALDKSKIRISKSEINSNDKNLNDKNTF